MNYFIEVPYSNKAKTDIDTIMRKKDFRNLSSKTLRDIKNESLARFFTKLLVVFPLLFKLKKGDVLFLQYPVKKFFALYCKIAHLKGAKTVALIHDLGSFRRRKLTAEQETRRLNNADLLIVHNESMKSWLEEQRINCQLLCLEIFDYLSDAVARSETGDEGGYSRVVYAGGLARKKNAFLYSLEERMHSWTLDLYGRGLEDGQAEAWEKISYHGFKQSDEFISTVKADFGLVWDGNSCDECDGVWGIYLRYNNPHKTSFYIRCELPLIMWKESALAPFVERNGIGILVDKLSELDERIKEVSEEEYERMKENIRTVSRKLSEGFYASRAFDKAISQLQ